MTPPSARPTTRPALEEKLDEAQDILREFNDNELRHWVEVEGKTQTEIAKIVGRDRSRVSRRCKALGIEPAHNTIPGKSVRPHTSDPVEEVVVSDTEEATGEVVDVSPVSP